ncbi:MAG: hypothetical protein ACYTGH_05975 [Planctomycetota bacterium]
MKTIAQDPAVAQFSEALTIHARQVRQYCTSSLSRIASLRPKQQPAAYEDFVLQSRQLLLSLRHSIQRSRWLQQEGTLNVERLEAEAEAIEGLIGRAESSAGSSCTLEANLAGFR